MPVYRENRFRVDGFAMHYSSLVPRLSDVCLSRGMKPNRTVPILSSRYPALAATQINAQVEFDRAFRTIVKQSAYRGKRVAFISDSNI